MSGKPVTPRGRKIARAQQLAQDFAALPLERKALPRFKRLASQLVEVLGAAELVKSADEAECPDCQLERDVCVC